MQTQDRQFFAIEKNLLVGLLTYLNERPHKEVADAIIALRNLPPVKIEVPVATETPSETK